jgi:hypothetical protein
MEFFGGSAIIEEKSAVIAQDGPLGVNQASKKASIARTRASKMQAMRQKQRPGRRE